MAITINDAAAFVRWLRSQGIEVDDCCAPTLHRLYRQFLGVR